MPRGDALRCRATVSAVAGAATGGREHVQLDACLDGGGFLVRR